MEAKPTKKDVLSFCGRLAASALSLVVFGVLANCASAWVQDRPDFVLNRTGVFSNSVKDKLDRAENCLTGAGRENGGVFSIELLADDSSKDAYDTVKKRMRTNPNENEEYKRFVAASAETASGAMLGDFVDATRAFHFDDQDAWNKELELSEVETPTFVEVSSDFISDSVDPRREIALTSAEEFLPSTLVGRDGTPVYQESRRVSQTRASKLIGVLEEIQNDLAPSPAASSGIKQTSAALRSTETAPDANVKSDGAKLSKSVDQIAQRPLFRAGNMRSYNSLNGNSRY